MGKKRNRHGRGKHRPVVRRRNGRKIFTDNIKDRHGEEGMMEYLNQLQEAARKTAQTGAGFVMKKVVPKEPDFWDSGIETIRSCGTAPERIPVTVGPLAMAKINALMAKYPRIEWLAYLRGTDYHVEDIIVPSQDVTAVRVDNIEGVDVPTIGVMHSHHGMGNGFSGTDHEYINQNHDISLCISHGGIAGQVRVKTACGKYVIVQATVHQVLEGFDGEAFIKDAEEKINEKTFAYTDSRFNPNRLGMEDELPDNGEFPVGFEGIGLVDMADSFIQDLENYPTTFETIDLVAYKEIVAEVIRPDRNRDIFEALYKNLLDNNSFEEENDTFLNMPIELLDELDSEFDDVNSQEQTKLVQLFQALKTAIDIIVTDIEENLEDIQHSELPEVEDNLWSSQEAGDGTEDDASNPIGECTCHEDPCVCSNMTWTTGEGQNMDGEGEESEQPSDNMWNTGGGHRTGTGNA
jgi:hypothetical protein